MHLDLVPGSGAELPPAYEERALYVATDSVEVGCASHGAGRLLVLEPEDNRFRSRRGATAMLLAGDPIGERYIHWNFVSFSKERLAQADADWRAGQMKLPDADVGCSSRSTTNRRPPRRRCPDRSPTRAVASDTGAAQRTEPVPVLASLT